jgi:hypothetical protein
MFGESGTAQEGLVPRALQHLFLGSGEVGKHPQARTPGKALMRSKGSGGGNTSFGFRPGGVDKENENEHKHKNASGQDSGQAKQVSCDEAGWGMHSPGKLSRYSMSSTAPDGSRRTHMEGSFVCKFSFYEIYQERVYDLLSTQFSTSDAASGVAECVVREDTVMGVYVDNCTEVVVDTLADAEEVRILLLLQLLLLLLLLLLLQWCAHISILALYVNACFLTI